jgi:hypothetical protein
MSTVAIVSGVLEGLQLLDSLIQSAGQVSAAITTAQASGQPVDWTGILGAEASAEAAVLAAIAKAKASGK